MAARLYASLGRVDVARRLAAELLPLALAHSSENLFYHHPLWPVAKLGITADVRNLFKRARPSPWRDAQLALLDGAFATAAQIYAEVGYSSIEAEIRMLAAEDLIESGHRAEGEVELQKAIAFYRTVGASFYINRCEQLLARSA